MHLKECGLFSIQSPDTRSFLNEWVMHQFFKKEEVLTTRYTFMPVYINNVEMGIYAVEEHFEKQLLESKDKREGPILKFDEEGFGKWFLIMERMDGIQFHTMMRLQFCHLKRKKQ